VYYGERVGSNPDKQFKATLFQSGRLMLGLNCLEPGQSQHAHTHADQDKFYFVAEGTGERMCSGDPHAVRWKAIIALDRKTRLAALLRDAHRVAFPHPESVHQRTPHPCRRRKRIAG